MIAYRIRVFGRVQGVFFRVSTRDKANELGLKGWVKNQQDGSVLIEATGESDAVDTFISWCHKGPLMAKVTEVTMDNIDPTELNDFIISY